MRSAALQFTCEALHAAAPLAEHLTDVAYEWAHQKKGRKLTHEEALTALCGFDGAPCDLFLRPHELLSHFAAHLTSRSRIAPRALLVGFPAKGHGVLSSWV